jgi:hypothetical protein
MTFAQLLVPYKSMSLRAQRGNLVAMCAGLFRVTKLLCRGYSIGPLNCRGRAVTLS